MTVITRRRLLLPSLTAVLGILGAVLTTGAFFPRAQPTQRIAAFIMKWSGAR